MKKVLTFALGATMALNLGMASVTMAAQQSYSTATFPFGTHITMGLPEQDVFVKHEGAPQDQVFRITPDDAKNAAILDQPVYSSSAAQQHDPFGVGPNPMGPYPMGKSLGFTMRQWLSAGGDTSYGCAGGQSTVSGSLHNLVPNGQYTVWYTRLTFPPNLKVVDRPLGAANGSQNSFKADASGNGTFSATFPGCLEDTSKETATLIVTAYHSNGETYGSAPGDFGRVTHVQNIAMVPPPSEPSTSAGAVAGMPKTGGMSEAGALNWPWAGLIVALFSLAAGVTGRLIQQRTQDSKLGTNR